MKHAINVGDKVSWNMFGEGFTPHIKRGIVVRVSRKHDFVVIDDGKMKHRVTGLHRLTRIDSNNEQELTE